MQATMDCDDKSIPQMFFDRARMSAGQEALRFKKDGAWHSIRWAEYDHRVRELARGLADWIWPSDVVSILSENRPEWCIADLAVLSLGGVMAPLYASSPSKDIGYILEDCEARLLFVSGAEQLAKIRDLRREGRLSKLDRVVVFDDVETTEDWVMPLASVAARNAFEPDPIPERLKGIQLDQVATLVYTSGTTGEPKGVKLSHRNIVSNVRGARPLIQELQLPERRMLSFLPLAHSLERVCGFYAALEYGFTMAFAESILKLPENIREVQPTVLISVPRIFEKMHARIFESAGGGPRRAMLDWAVRVGTRYATARLEGRSPGWMLSLQHHVADRLIFQKIRAALGGKLRYAVSGGAPLAKELAEFFSAAGVTVLEGYGLTEASPIVSGNRPGAVRFGSVGKPWPDVEVRIHPEPERKGEGEVLVRGPNVMLGYHNKPLETAETIDTDGWLHTGDIGFIDSDGYLHITDRKKDLLKTSGGKYVAPQPIENRLRMDRLVDQAVLLGDRRKYCVALLSPKLETLGHELHRALPADRDELSRDPEVRSLYQAVLDDINKDLGSWEQIKRFQLLPSELSQESGELTPTLKVKRRVVERKFATLIDSLYAEG